MGVSRERVLSRNIGREELSNEKRCASKNWSRLILNGRSSGMPCHRWRPDVLAGEEGFEPSHAGIKIRCLNQLGDSPRKPLILDECPQGMLLEPSRHEARDIRRPPCQDFVRLMFGFEAAEYAGS
jgi:hypothetical protein